MERRRHPRTQLQMSLSAIRLDPEGGDVVDRLHMLDISKGGMGAMTDRTYYPGQRLMLRLPLSENSGRRNVYATVVRCMAREEGYKIGLEFDAASVGSWCGVSTTTAIAA